MPILNDSVRELINDVEGQPLGFLGDAITVHDGFVLIVHNNRDRTDNQRRTGVVANRLSKLISSMHIIWY